MLHPRNNFMVNLYKYQLPIVISIRLCSVVVNTQFSLQQTAPKEWIIYTADSCARNLFCFCQHFLMEPPTMLLVPICRDMQLWWDKSPIPSPRKRIPTETCFDDVGRIVKISAQVSNKSRTTRSRKTGAFVKMAHHENNDYNNDKNNNDGNNKNANNNDKMTIVAIIKNSNNGTII